MELLATAGDSPHGGLLAVPLADTLKRADDDLRVEQTVPRNGLWRCNTPQLFPLGALKEAIESGTSRGLAITDEASAMEAAGYAPQLVEDRPDNIKITRHEDLALAELFLAAEIEALERET